MAEFPFQLQIKSGLSAGQTEILTCTALLRVVPGSREVYDALWNKRAVIVKIFSHKINASRHFKGEWRGLNLLQARGINSPKALFFGKTSDGRRAVVAEKIIDATVVLDVFKRAKNPAQQFDLLMAVCRELSNQHRNGIIQKDLHLGNFLIKGERIFTIDPGQVCFFAGEIGKNKSLSQAALLACNLPGITDESAVALCRGYAGYRGWTLERSDIAFFKKQMVLQRKRGIRNGLKKSLRTSKNYLRIKTDGCVCVFDRSFCQTEQAVEFLRRIDALMDEGQILKKGNTCYVSRVMWNNKDVVVKRYNHKGFIHSLCHTIRRSRARRNWLHGHRLEMLNIDTPKPVAYIEKYKGLLVWSSYIVTEFVQGQNLHYFLRDENIAKEQKAKTCRRVGELLDKLNKFRISHGDLKLSNIIIAESGPKLIDLDGMAVHKCKWMYRLRGAKDLKSWEDLQDAAGLNIDNAG